MQAESNVTPVVEWPEESSCMTEVVKKLQGSVLPFISCKEIILYTQLKITDPDQDAQGGTTSSIYHANPNYKDGSWHDWANIEWPEWPPVDVNAVKRVTCCVG